MTDYNDFTVYPPEVSEDEKIVGHAYLFREFCNNLRRTVNYLVNKKGKFGVC